MHKLTIFTVILSIVVVVVVAELMFDNVLTAEEGQADILTSQTVHPSLVNTDADAAESDVELNANDIEALLAEDAAEDDVEIDIEALLAEDDLDDVEIEILSLENGKLSAEVLRNAGFPNSDLVEAAFDGSIYQTIDVSDLSLNVEKNYVANKEEVFGAIYTFSVDGRIQNELYRVLRERAAFGTSVEVNETNTFGDNSFYMNDNRRESTAFLVIRSGSSFYAFAYPKKYHKYFKPLSQNL